MAWTAPRTWVASETLTAALLNTHVRDNLLETAPAKVTTAGDICYATGANAITRLAIGTAGAVLVARSSALAWTSAGITASAGNARHVNISATVTASANSDNLQAFTMSNMIWAKGAYTGLIVSGMVIDCSSWSATGSGTISTVYGIYLDAPTVGVTNWTLYSTAGNMRLGGTSSSVYIGDTSNANQTAGITITSGAGDERFTAKLSGFAHGVTGVSETDTAFTLAVSNATTGGIDLIGFRTGSANYGLRLRSIVAAGDTTKSAAAVAATIISSALSSGTTYASLGANTNLLAVADSLSTVRFILDADGDSHQDVGTAWTNFDNHDDASLLTALSVNVSRADDPIREKFREFLVLGRAELQAAKLVTFNDDGHHFVNMSKLTMLLTGAVRQLAGKLQEVNEKIAILESKLTLLEG